MMPDNLFRYSLQAPETFLKHSQTIIVRLFCEKKLACKSRQIFLLKSFTFGWPATPGNAVKKLSIKRYFPSYVNIFVSLFSPYIFDFVAQIRKTCYRKK